MFRTYVVNRLEFNYYYCSKQSAPTMGAETTHPPVFKHHIWFLITISPRVIVVTLGGKLEARAVSRARRLSSSFGPVKKTKSVKQFRTFLVHFFLPLSPEFFFLFSASNPARVHTTVLHTGKAVLVPKMCAPVPANTSSLSWTIFALNLIL